MELPQLSTLRSNILKTNKKLLLILLTFIFLIGSITTSIIISRISTDERGRARTTDPIQTYFRDQFEVNLSKWQLRLPGTVSISTEKKFDGTKSLKILNGSNNTNNFISAVMPNLIYGKTGVWMYDDMSNDAWRYISLTDENYTKGISVGIKPDVSTTHYTYCPSEKVQGCMVTRTKRSEGWHHFKINVTPKGAYGMLDNENLTELFNNSVNKVINIDFKYFRRLNLGVSGSTTKPVYFDASDAVSFPSPADEKDVVDYYVNLYLRSYENINFDTMRSLFDARAKDFCSTSADPCTELTAFGTPKPPYWHYEHQKGHFLNSLLFNSAALLQKYNKTRNPILLNKAITMMRYVFTQSSFWRNSSVSIIPTNIGIYAMLYYMGQNILPADLKYALEENTTFLINKILSKPLTSSVYSEFIGNSSGEENSWPGHSMALAAAVFKHKPEAKEWYEKSKFFVAHALSRGETYGGFTSRTIYQNFIMDNHDYYPHPTYGRGVTSGNMASEFIYKKLTGVSTPEFRKNTLEVTKKMDTYIDFRDFTFKGNTIQTVNALRTCYQYSSQHCSVMTWGRNNGTDLHIPVVADYMHDKRKDVAVWDPKTGTWFIHEYGRYNGGASYPKWGIQNATIFDTPIPADYIGDSKAELAVWRKQDGRWYIKDYPGGNYPSWGTNGDVPVPADYIGDEKADLAVWRPSNGTWYIKGAPINFHPRGQYPVLGQQGDVPVPGNYYGDAKTDIAVWRPSNGSWYLGDGTAIRYGLSTDKPLPADYDGDGKTDIAVWRPSTGQIHIYQKPTSYLPPIGSSSDLPLSYDFNADGKSDFGVWNQLTGRWDVIIRNNLPNAFKKSSRDDWGSTASSIAAYRLARDLYGYNSVSDPETGFSTNDLYKHAIDFVWYIQNSYLAVSAPANVTFTEMDWRNGILGDDLSDMYSPSYIWAQNSNALWRHMFYYFAHEAPIPATVTTPTATKQLTPTPSRVATPTTTTMPTRTTTPTPSRPITPTVSATPSRALTPTPSRALTPIPTSTPVSNIRPVGKLEAFMNNSYVKGFAFDQNVPNTSVEVHFYLNAPFNQGGTYIGKTLANQVRSDVNTAYKITGNHGFVWSIPSQYRNGSSYNMYAYSIDANTSGVSVLLEGSPLPFKIITPTPTTIATPTATARPTTTPVATLTATPSRPATPTPTPTIFGLQFEAEAGSITAPLSNKGTYIENTSNTNDPATAGRASYKFRIPEDGTYVIQMRVDVKDYASNTLFVEVDSEPTSTVDIWDISPTSGFATRYVRKRDGISGIHQFKLKAGTHELILRGRESNLKIDWIKFIKQTESNTNSLSADNNLNLLSTCTLHTKGDSDCDNAITLSDFENFRQEYLVNKNRQGDVIGVLSDFNNDDTIDLIDFNIFRNGYTQRTFGNELQNL